MPLIKTDGATIHYLTLPDVQRCPEGMPAVTFCHGRGGNAQAFLFQLPFLQAHGFFTISISLRGWGNSRLDGDDETLLDSKYLANDVKAVLDACGVEKTAIVGHSIGGFSVTRMLLEAPERVTHAVMSSTFYGIADAIVTNYMDNTDNFSEAFRAAQPALAWLYDSMNDVNSQAKALTLNSRFKLLQSSGGVAPAALQAAFKGPLLFTVTEADPAVPAGVVEYVASLFTYSSLLTGNKEKKKVAVHCFRGPLRHAPFIEDPDQYNAALLAFLKKGGDFYAFSDGEADAPPSAAVSIAWCVLDVLSTLLLPLALILAVVYTGGKMPAKPQADIGMMPHGEMLKYM